MSTKINHLETKKKYWESEYEKIAVSIATLEFRIETLKGLPNDKVVGEKPTSTKIGNIQGMRLITAKELLEDSERELNEKLNMKRALEKLLGL